MAFVVQRRPGSKPSLLSSMPKDLLGSWSTNGKGGALVDTSAKTHRKPVDKSANLHGSALAYPKDDPARSEPYLRLVAARACKNCGRQKNSQAAHLPPAGKAIKQDDRETFPLCADGPRRKGCHGQFDRYELMPREQAMKQGRKWAAETRAEIEADGLWPKKLPKFAKRKSR